MSEVNRLIEIVRHSRQATAPVFPLPNMDRCVRYAITELGEFFDAELRATASGELRNNDKAHDPRSEWGQAGYMIASALIQATNIEPMPENYTVTPYMVLMLVCDYAFSSEAGDLYAADYLVDALHVWAKYCAMHFGDPAAVLSQTCAAFELKRLGRAVTDIVFG